MINYEVIKETAKEKGLKVRDLLALAPNNDPFYTGRPSEVDAAQWFTDLWLQFGYDDGVHLRRIHYRIVSHDSAIDMPNGDKYENTQRCWAYLNNAAKWARYLGLVNSTSFVDRRNPDPHIFRRFADVERESPNYAHYSDHDSEWELYQLPGLPEWPNLWGDLPRMPYFEVRGYDVEQPYLVEVWSEKTTMNDVLIPLCQEYNVNLVTGSGELSITAVLKFLARVSESELPARILYISDYDPAGL